MANMTKFQGLNQQRNWFIKSTMSCFENFLVPEISSEWISMIWYNDITYKDMTAGINSLGCIAMSQTSNALNVCCKSALTQECSHITAYVCVELPEEVTWIWN